MTFTIRQATTTDQEALCDILQEGDAYHQHALPHIFRRPRGPARSAAYMHHVLTDPNTAVFVAEADGQMIGAVHLVIRETPDIPILVPRRYAMIDNLIVRQAFRRSGVGRALMEQAQRWARQKGAQQIELNVWEFNESAIAFYKTLGYKTSSRKMSKAVE